ncbi:hypothetical protein [Methanosarcina horonobensis]|uniref:hypothetical protein n=1 Tax=Methanosarcina horonobensis TaxID=418008 RepID=UPI00064FB5AB|nr:hypothetical protein [Methanosarcina horonobensis]
MKVKNSKAMKWLRAFHILTSSVWFGGVVAIGALAWICFFRLEEATFLTVAPLVPELFPTVIAPAALLIIAQGIFYGFFTGWGFLKHRWVILKWIGTFLLFLLTGMGTVGQMFSTIQKVEMNGFTGGLADGGMVLLFIAMQILIMGIMICVSVFKPFGKKAKV